MLTLLSARERIKKDEESEKRKLWYITSKTTTFLNVFLLHLCASVTHRALSLCYLFLLLLLFSFFCFQVLGCASANRDEEAAPATASRKPPRRSAKAPTARKPNAIAPLAKPTKGGEVRKDTRTPLCVLFKHR